MYPLEMGLLIPGIDLKMVEIIYRTLRRGRRGGGGYLEKLEHFATEVGRVRARSSADEYAFLFELEDVSAQNKVAIMFE